MINIPNILTLFRFILIPVFTLFYFSGSEYGPVIATAVFLLASATDVLDGIIARKFNMTSILGKIIDPLADKCMQVTVFICLWINRIVPLWFICLIIAKEAIMVLGGIFMLKKQRNMIPSRWYGKLTTVLFFVAIIILIAFESIPSFCVNMILIVPVFFMMLAFILYIRDFKTAQK